MNQTIKKQKEELKKMHKNICGGEIKLKENYSHQMTPSVKRSSQYSSCLDTPV